MQHSPCLKVTSELRKMTTLCQLQLLIKIRRPRLKISPPKSVDVRTGHTAVITLTATISVRVDSCSWKNGSRTTCIIHELVRKAASQVQRRAWNQNLLFNSLVFFKAMEMHINIWEARGSNSILLFAFKIMTLIAKLISHEEIALDAATYSSFIPIKPCVP